MGRRLRVILAVIGFFWVTSCMQDATYESDLVATSDRVFPLAKQVHETSDLDFRKASGSSYLAMAIPYSPIAELRENFSRESRFNLKDRGEAHITVITPPEFAILKSKLTMDDLLRLAESSKIQSTAFSPLCIGSGTKRQQSITMSTYYVVVEAPGLNEIRQKIAETFVARGGESEKFIATSFFPHITIGFDHRDLHFEDGVRKDTSTCIAKIQED